MSDPYFHVTRTGKTLGYFCWLKNNFIPLCYQNIWYSGKGCVAFEQIKNRLKRREAYDEYWCILCGNHRQLDLVCERIYEFSDFSQDIRALPEAPIASEPAGDIRGGLQE